MARPFRAPGDQSWGSVLVDVGVVVVGVLIAFALNSWWADRNAEERRRAHLRALEGDLVRNIAALDRQAATRRRIRESSRALFDLLRRDGPPPRDSAVRHLRGVYRSSQYEPVLGAYENVVSSGGLSQLGDPELQASLATLVAVLRNDYYRRFETETYLTLIRQYPSVLGHIAPGNGPPVLESGGAPLDSVLSRPGFQSLLYSRMNTADDLENRLRELRGLVRSVLERVRSELPEDGVDSARAAAGDGGADSSP